MKEVSIAACGGGRGADHRRRLLLERLLRALLRLISIDRALAVLVRRHRAPQVRRVAALMACTVRPKLEATSWRSTDELR
jgi:hypothetical protein